MLSFCGNCKHNTQAISGAIALLHRHLLLLMIHLEETRLGANRNPKPNPEVGYESAIVPNFLSCLNLPSNQI